jgi:hypothetical protein
MSRWLAGSRIVAALFAAWTVTSGSISRTRSATAANESSWRCM